MRHARSAACSAVAGRRRRRHKQAVRHPRTKRGVLKKNSNSKCVRSPLGPCMVMHTHPVYSSNRMGCGAARGCTCISQRGQRRSGGQRCIRVVAGCVMLVRLCQKSGSLHQFFRTVGAIIGLSLTVR